MMRFLVFLLLVCYVDVCACIRSELQSSVSPQKDLFYLKEKTDPDRAETTHSNTPHMSTS